MKLLIFSGKLGRRASLVLIGVNAAGGGIPTAADPDQIGRAFGRSGRTTAALWFGSSAFQVYPPFIACAERSSPILADIAKATTAMLASSATMTILR